jgi:ankyrin repeat protein
MGSDALFTKHPNNSWQVSSLHLACRNGHAETVLFLIENNADILMEKVDNSLPIHDAAFGGHVECAKILLRAGEASQLPSETHLSKRMEGGSSPLHIASKRGHPDLVRCPLPPHSTSPLTSSHFFLFPHRQFPPASQRRGRVNECACAAHVQNDARA